MCSWNCRGLGKSSTRQRLKQICRSNYVDLVFLSETKKSPQFVTQFATELGYNVLCNVPPLGLRGGLVLLGKSTLDVTILSHSDRMIDVQIQHASILFYLTCVYGHPIQSMRNNFWNTLSQIAQTRPAPWAMIGDFNEITCNDEKLGGNPRDNSSFVPFCTMLRDCDMTNLTSSGNPFTWSGNRLIQRNGFPQLETIQCCLDKAMANSEWQAKFPASEVKFLEPSTSDHRPLVLTISQTTSIRRGQFRFDRRLLHHPDFEDIVRDGWSLRNGQLSLPKSIRQCRRHISRWTKSADINSQHRIQRLTSELDDLLQSHHPDPTSITRLRRQIDKAYSDEEIFWKQKSRISWLKEGDRNTKFFHSYAKVRKARNRITAIRDSQHNDHYGDEAISQVAQDYFLDLFKSSAPASWDGYFDDILPRVTGTMNTNLTADITNAEIKAAMFSIRPDKSPGADGISSGFYQKYWHIVEETFCHDIRQFFDTGSLTQSINHTNIVLIPKTDSPLQMSDFRPISLCSVAYKVVSKVLVKRLQSILPSLISETQTAFVPGRNIGDNVLLAHELIHSLKVRKRQSKTYMAVKTDISKAYDRVEWDFLRCAMIAMGFCDKWINWIMGCITTTSFSILINGSPFGYFKPARGLRQGDPLSPYLFLFCAEILSQKLDHAKASGRLKGLSISNHGPRINHLFFADDSLFFCQANRHDSLVLATILQDYGRCSGQLVNYSKSSISFGSRVFLPKQNVVKTILDIHAVGGCGKYLGLPEYFGRNKREMFRSLVTKVQDRTNGWQNKFLSPGGKEVLIKSVALALPVYPMNFFKLPASICNDIDNVLSKFWWGTTTERRRMSWFGWKRLSHSKQKGGLGFRDLQDYNTALLGKQAWRILHNPTSLLARTLKSRYFPTTSFLEASTGTKPSFGWSSLLHGKDFLKKGLRWHIGEGEIPLWTANWIPSDPPKPATNITNSPLQYVHDLWSNNTWDSSKLQLLPSAEREAVSRIYVPHCAVPDKLIWHYAKDGEYTVKSGYHYASSLRPFSSESSPPNVNHEIVTRIWNSKLPSRQKHFLWKACTNSLSTTSALASRGLAVMPTCLQCRSGQETPNHVLFTCPYATQTWVMSQFPPFLTHQVSDSLETNLQTIFTFGQLPGTSALQKQLPFSLLWQLWKSRNNLVFNATPRASAEDVHTSMCDALAWTDHNSTPHHISMPSPPLNFCQWHPPPTDWYKCNYDASFIDMHHFSRAGWITRDSLGQFMLAGFATLQPSSSPLQAEAFALLHALHHLWIRGIRKVILEGDSESLFYLLTGNSGNMDMFNVVSDIRFWISKFHQVRFNCTRRHNNKIADHLAHQAPLDSLSCCILNSPSEAINVLLSETL